jgi:hypothetical protein
MLPVRSLRHMRKVRFVLTTIPISKSLWCTRIPYFHTQAKAPSKVELFARSGRLHSVAAVKCKEYATSKPRQGTCSRANAPWTKLLLLFSLTAASNIDFELISGYCVCDSVNIEPTSTRTTIFSTTTWWQDTSMTLWKPPSWILSTARSFLELG